MFLLSVSLLACVVGANVSAVALPNGGSAVARILLSSYNNWLLLFVLVSSKFAKDESDFIKFGYL